MPIYIGIHARDRLFGRIIRKQKNREVQRACSLEGAADCVTEGRLNDPIEWSAPLSLQLPRISICSSRTNLTIAAKPVYLKSDRTSPMTPAPGLMTAGSRYGHESCVGRGRMPALCWQATTQRLITIGNTISALSHLRTKSRIVTDIANSEPLLRDIFQYELRHAYTWKAYISEIYMSTFVFTHIIKSILWLRCQLAEVAC